MKKIVTLAFAFCLSFAMLSPELYSAPKFRACKSLKSQQCKKRKDCTWVKKSKRKNGTKVRAHCRKIGKKKK